jgi:DNA-binding CsgD family transcriptional regulator/PAS domain-containing protein
MHADGQFTALRDDLLNALYASVSEVPAWESFVHTAREAFKCHQAAVVIQPTDHGPPVVTCTDNSQLTAVELLLTTLGSDLIDGKPVALTTDCTDWLVLPITDRGPSQPGTDSASYHASIVLGRSGKAATFGQTELDLLASLADPLRRSLRIYRRIRDLVRQVRVHEVALESSRIGVALIGMDGEVMLTNVVADELFAKREGLYLSRGYLHAEKPQDTAMLMAEIRRCAEGQTAETDRAHYTPLPFARSDNALPLTVIVRPGPAFYPLPRPHRRTAILVIRDPASKASWPAPALARLFGLSAAEAVLASELARGASLEEAATTLGVSRNTVRTQLQNIFLKTGINRQSELIRALLSSAATST